MSLPYQAGGPSGVRTRNFILARDARSQLRHKPIGCLLLRLSLFLSGLLPRATYLISNTVRTANLSRGADC